MTDNEIIKALECCRQLISRCEDCPINKGGFCFDHLKTEALDLINRLKADNERLREEIGSLNKAYPCRIDDIGNNCLVYARSLDDYDSLIGDISAEAIKEFAERLKSKIEIDLSCGVDSADYLTDVLPKDIDNLVKEMVGDNE